MTSFAELGGLELSFSHIVELFKWAPRLPFRRKCIETGEVSIRHLRFSAANLQNLIGLDHSTVYLLSAHLPEMLGEEYP